MGIGVLGGGTREPGGTALGGSWQGVNLGDWKRGFCTLLAVGAVPHPLVLVQPSCCQNILVVQKTFSVF